MTEDLNMFDGRFATREERIAEVLATANEHARQWVEDEAEPDDDRTPEQQKKDWETLLLAIHSNPTPELF